MWLTGEERFIFFVVLGGGFVLYLVVRFITGILALRRGIRKLSKRGRSKHARGDHHH